jgi:hypothetical protein
MSGNPIEAESSKVTEEDTLRQDLVKGLLAEQGKVLSEYGMHVATLSFAAIAVVLTMGKDWLDQPMTALQKALLGVAIFLYLVAAAVGTIGAGLIEHQVTLDDYWEIEAELKRIAGIRFRAVSIAAVFACIATGIVAAAALT